MKSNIIGIVFFKSRGKRLNLKGNKSKIMPFSIDYTCGYKE